MIEALIRVRVNNSFRWLGNVITPSSVIDVPKSLVNELIATNQVEAAPDAELRSVSVAEAITLKPHQRVHTY